MTEQSEIQFKQPNADERTGAGHVRTIGEAVERIRESALSEAEKGRGFESLVQQVLPTIPEYEMVEVWRFPDWPDRERVLGRDGTDLGIDLVARLKSGGFAAIQCKFWASHRTLNWRDLSTFIGDSSPTDRGNPFYARFVFTTCRWTRAVDQQLAVRNGRIHLFVEKHRDDPIDHRTIKRPHDPLPKQQEAIERCVEGLRNHDRGQLIMACGTGKTFTSLRIAEAYGADHILFVAPSIALVGQARREWLRQSKGNLESIIVCSDSTSGRVDDNDKALLELDCPVTRNPGQIARFMRRPVDGLRVVFCTHQSLPNVSAAQAENEAGTFDLTIIDEAHWTAGAVKDEASRKANYSFQDVHDDNHVQTHKRLYMTATPRVYTAKSKNALETKGIVVHDMDDEAIYGPEIYRLSFRSAVEAPGPNGDPMLCDYRVVVLVIREDDITPAMQNRLARHGDDEQKQALRKAGLSESITKVYGTALALNGEMVGPSIDLPESLGRTITFTNRIPMSKWYANALMDSKVRERTTRSLKGERQAGAINAQHLDAKDNAYARTQALDRLRRGGKDGSLEVLCNVKLFSEGVDVPALDAVVFLEPRASQIDVVQAVGRVMRRAPDKSLGYIVVPVVVPSGEATLNALSKRSDGYQVIGQVLRALQSHDGRLAESIAQMVVVAQPRPDDGGEEGGGGTTEEQEEIILEHLGGDDLIANIVDASGLGSAGKQNAEDIKYAVEMAGRLFHEAGAAEALCPAIGETFGGDGTNAKRQCKVGALLIANACLLHKRLSALPHLSLAGLEGMGASQDPAAGLRADWQRILERDYRPVFNPALAALDALPDDEDTKRGVRRLIRCANHVADSLSDLGYDHAGPLYHRILGTAKSDGAFYTQNTAALLLAELALPKDWIDWNDANAVSKLRAIDPACGTGTLLMAALKVVKERVLAHLPEHERRHVEGPLHKDLVENVIHGLDINHQAAQLAASNLTLGAPEVDYQRMNIHSMAHGPQADGRTRAGSLELLVGDRIALESGKTSSVREGGGIQVDGADRDVNPAGAFDLVIMNPPFTNNTKRGAKYDDATKKAMRQREQLVEREVEERQGYLAASVINYNSVRTFFTPMADHLLKGGGGGHWPRSCL